MSRLPIPGQDSGTWGDILNDYLSQSLKPSGQIKDNAVTANTLAPNSVTSAAIATGAVNTVSIADGSIEEIKLDPAVQSRINASTELSVDGTPVATYNLDTTPLTASDVGAYTMTQTDDMIANAVAGFALATGGTLTDPKINILRDVNNNPQIELNTYFTQGTASNQVNYLTIFNGTAGVGQPSLSVSGPDANIGITLLPKGYGGVIIYSPTDSPSILGYGPGSSQNLNLVSGGTGVILANGVEVATISGTQTLTNKTISGLSNTLSNIAISSLVPSTSAALSVGTIELGHASDTTLSRSSAGRLAVEGANVVTASSTDTLTNKTLTSPAVGGTVAVAQNGSLSLYNTSDQTTNYENGVLRWRSNILEVGTLFGGSASYRNVRLGVSITAGAGTVDRFLEISRLTPFASFNWGNIGLTGQIINIGASAASSLTASSGTQTGLGIDPAIVQSSTAGYTMLLVNPTETTTGTGTKLLADFQVGGVSLASVSNLGVMAAKNYATTLVTRTTATSLGLASAGVNPCDATTAAFTITLPNANVQTGISYTIKKVDSSANAVTVASSGGTIDGAATYSLAAQYKYVRVVSNGTNWFIVGSN